MALLTWISLIVTSAASLMGCQQEADEGTAPTGKSLEENFHGVGRALGAKKRQ